MPLALKQRGAVGASLKHLSASLFVGLAAAALVFRVWYPFPYRELSGGRELFFLLVTVDVVVGPLLTLVAFDRRKLRGELWRDMLVIVTLQLAALAYGLHTVHAARPVFLAFEGNRFRAVSAAEIDQKELGQAADDLGELSLSGPRLIGVRLASSSDPEFLDSLKMSLAGKHPALRPSRWVHYESQRLEVAAAAKPLAALYAAHPVKAAEIDAVASAAGARIDALAYLPLQSRTVSDWIVIVNRTTGLPVGFAHVDGW